MNPTARGTVKLALVLALFGSVLAVVVSQQQALAALREQRQALGRRLEQLRQLEAENQRLGALAATLRPDRPDSLPDELARLRGEAEGLRTPRGEWEQLAAENRQLRAQLGEGLRPFISRDDCAYVGYADPEAALQSTFWAQTCGDPAMAVASLLPADRAAWAVLSDQEIADKLARSWSRSTGFQILGQKKVSDDEVIVIVNLYPDRPDIENAQLPFKRIGSEWREDLALYPMSPAREKAARD